MLGRTTTTRKRPLWLFVVSTICLWSLLAVFVLLLLWRGNYDNTERFLETRRPHPPAMTRLLSQITDRPQLTTLYQAAAHWQTNDNNNNTLFRAIQEVQRCNCTSLIISCAGQNVFAPFFSSSSGWIGKTLTVNKNNNMFAVNDYQDGSTAFPGTIYVAPFLSAIGSPFHVLFGLDVSTLFSWPFVFDVSYDEHPSVILDYRAKNVFVPVVDGLRPVSHHSLAAAGLEVDETVDDLWIGCMAYTLFGVLNLFSHYFVLEFLPATQTLS